MLYSFVAEARCHTGCEVGIAVRWDDQAKIHETRSNDLVVHQNAADIFRRNLTFSSRTPLINPQTS